MNPRRAILGQIQISHFVPNKGSLVTAIDGPTLLSRLLFFDEVIVRSTQLQEIPFLIKLFGLEGFTELLDKNILRFSCEVANIILDSHLNGKRDLPLLWFKQATVDVPNHSEYISHFEHYFLGIANIPNQKREDLFHRIGANLLRPHEFYKENLLNQVRQDLTANNLFLRTLIARSDPSLSLDPKDIAVRVVQPSMGIQIFESNLHNLLGISKEKEHDIFSGVTRAAANLNQRLADMQAYSAITLFADSEASLLSSKLYGFLLPYNPQIIESSFLRILALTDIPEFLVTGRIDVTRLLEIRESSECVEFRTWLSTTDSIDDQRLRELIGGLRARTAGFLSSTTGKTVRFLTNAALGFVPHYGTAMSLIEGAIDNFLLDKLLPSSGILSFLNRSIPSVFASDNS